MRINLLTSYQVDGGLDVRFLRHANSTHVLQTVWRGLLCLYTNEGSVSMPSTTCALHSSKEVVHDDDHA